MSASYDLIAPTGDLPFPLVPRPGPARLSVVIPVLNEAGTLELLFERVAAALRESDVAWSVLFVSDGSTDDTVPVLEALAARDDRVTYVCLSRNFGHQAALTAGLDHVDADSDLVVTMDGDLQHPPELLPVLVDAWRRGYDVVHTRKLSTKGLPLWRRLVTRIAYAAIGRMAEINIIPEASDFRLLDRTALRALIAMPERNRLYRGLTPWIGFRQALVPYSAGARAHGDSRYGLRQLIQLFSRSFFDFSNAPLHVGVIMGAVTILVCAAYASFTLVAYVTGHGVPTGYVSLVFLIVLLSSINLTFSGIVGVYVARIYDEVRRRPTYVIGQGQQDAGSARTSEDAADLEQLRPL